MRRRSVVWMTIAAAVVATSLVVAADLTGTWVGTTEIPNHGTDRLTLVLKKGLGGYNGTIADALGLIAKGTAITEVKLNGDVLTFGVPVGDGVHRVRMQFKGDKATAEWTLPGADPGTLLFERQKK